MTGFWAVSSRIFMIFVYINLIIAM